METLTQETSPFNDAFIIIGAFFLSAFLTSVSSNLQFTTMQANVPKVYVPSPKDRKQ
jgi:hypothetical protein